MIESFLMLSNISFFFSFPLNSCSSHLFIFKLENILLLLLSLFPSIDSYLTSSLFSFSNLFLLNFSIKNWSAFSIKLGVFSSFTFICFFPLKLLFFSLFSSSNGSDSLLFKSILLFKSLIAWTSLSFIFFFFFFFLGFSFPNTVYSSDLSIFNSLNNFISSFSLGSSSSLGSFSFDKNVIWFDSI